MGNQLKTLVFLTMLSGILMAFGYGLGGSSGLILGFGLALVMNFVSYWFSDSIVLAMHHARELRSGESQGIYEMVQGLAMRAGLPTPRVFVIPDHSPNAFATGRDPYHSAVAVTEGLLGLLSYEELEGVLAHEISHIKNRDTLVSTIAATLASAIMFIANMARWAAIFGGVQRGDSDDDRGGGVVELLLMAVVAPIAATLIQFAISRSREYLADATGARICGNPEQLASALRKIHNAATGLPLQAGGPATAHLYIVNPFSGAALLNLFSTHPPVEERISRLLGVRPE